MTRSQPDARSSEVSATDRAAVLYDGSCPLCRREIAFAKRRDADATLNFVDISRPEAAIPDGADRTTLMARFHVVDADGALRSGADAFGVMWEATPGLGWLGRWVRHHRVRPVAEFLYGLFLRGRPAMQRLARRAERGSRG